MNISHKMILTTTPLEQLTGSELHALPEPTPTTLMGLQSRPMGTAKPLRTTAIELNAAMP